MRVTRQAWVAPSCLGVGFTLSPWPHGLLQSHWLPGHRRGGEHYGQGPADHGPHRLPQAGHRALRHPPGGYQGQAAERVSASGGRVLWGMVGRFIFANHVVKGRGSGSILWFKSQLHAPLLGDFEQLCALSELLFLHLRTESNAFSFGTEIMNIKLECRIWHPVSF